MRILHTADWHVGRTLRGRSRADEHRAVLAEITAIAAREEVELAIVAGDLFDTAAPSPEAEEIVYRALLDLADVTGAVVAVAGNHDNPRRFEALAPLFRRAAGVHLAAELLPPEAGGVLDLETRSGAAVRIALLPFLSQRGIVRAQQLLEEDADRHAQEYAKRGALVIERLCSGFSPQQVNLVVGHLMVAGGSLGGGERLAHTIADYALSPLAFPPTAHYVALGHLHVPQAFPGRPWLRYCGSPLQLDFGDREEAKSVLLAELHPGTPAEIEAVPLTSGRRLRTLRGRFADLAAQSLGAGDDFLRLIVEEAPRAGLAEELRELFPDAVEVRVAEEPPGPSADDSDLDHSRRSPQELFADFLGAREVLDQRLAELFAELLEEALAPDPADR